jgi:hypothetical protein
MRQLALALLLASFLAPAAKAAPDHRLEASEVRGGFSKRFAADTLPATLPKKVGTTAPTAGIRVTAEVGAD